MGARRPFRPCRIRLRGAVSLGRPFCRYPVGGDRPEVFAQLIAMGAEDLFVGVYGDPDSRGRQISSRGGEFEPEGTGVGGVRVAPEHAALLQDTDYPRRHHPVGARHIRRLLLSGACAVARQPSGGGQQIELSRRQPERAQVPFQRCSPLEGGVMQPEPRGQERTLGYCPRRSFSHAVPLPPRGPRRCAAYPPAFPFPR